MYFINFCWKIFCFADIKYDRVKDEQEQLEKKQKQLENIEEARKREEEARKKGIHKKV